MRGCWKIQRFGNSALPLSEYADGTEVVTSESSAASSTGTMNQYSRPIKTPINDYSQYFTRFGDYLAPFQPDIQLLRKPATRIPF